MIAPSKWVNIHTKKGIVKGVFGWPWVISNPIKYVQLIVLCNLACFPLQHHENKVHIDSFTKELHVQTNLGFV